MKSAKEIIRKFEHELKANGHIGVACAASLTDPADCRYYTKVDNKYNLLALTSSAVFHASTALQVHPFELLNMIEKFIAEEISPEVLVDPAFADTADFVWILTEKNEHRSN